MILGVKEKILFEEKTVFLEKGDILLLYTDGIIEAQNEAEELFGTDQLCSLLATHREKPPEDIIDTVLQEVAQFAGAEGVQDDISMVIMKVE
jgi:sigma-B regulation protein RsbU (phosphoserine phosphatase)